jgi:hypothetical protein
MTPAPALAILSGANQPRSEAMSKSWNEMSDPEKLETLRETCERLDQQIRQQGAWINDLLGRVDALEGK